MTNVLLTPGYRRSLLIRRVIAAVLILIAAVVTLRPTHHPTVVTFASDVAVGTKLEESHLAQASVPETLIPESAVTDPEKAVGSIVVNAAGAGEIVTTHRITGAQLLADVGGSTITPVRLADPTTAALLAHGDEVSIVTAAEDNSPIVVAEHGTVVVVDPEEPDTVLVALDAEAAHRVASTALTSPLAVVMTTFHGV